MRLHPVIKLLRIDHWFKNLFILLGVATAIWYSKIDLFQIEILAKILLAFFVASFVSSANYIINQIADAKFDIKHESKRERPIPSGKVSIKNSLLIFTGLLILSLGISLTFFSNNFTIVLIGFAIAGFAYNIKPIRLKDIPFIDVLSESINNPIRFLLGWFVVAGFMPPISLILFTWSYGAIFMTAKRYDELNYFGKKLILYRATFQMYSLKGLKFLLYLYSFISLLFLSIFFLEFNKNLLYVLPLMVVFIIWFLRNVISGNANARSIESFVQTPKFILFTVAILLLAFILLS